MRPLSASAAGPRRNAALSDDDLAERVHGVMIAPGVIRVDTRFPLPYQHGYAVVDGGLWPEQSARHPSSPDHSGCRSGACFLDTETNGLSGGTGTLAFIIGIGRLDRRALCLSQWLLIRMGCEPALLTTALSEIEKAEQVVTYNGAAFDLPLLTNRSRLARVACGLAKVPHLDLLPWVRRVRPDRWPNARLATVEQFGFGFERSDDLAGREAPVAWQEWLIDRSADKLARLLLHNRGDLLSLAALHALALTAGPYRRPPRHRQQLPLFDALVWPRERMEFQ